jgi:inner membrane protein
MNLRTSVIARLVVMGIILLGLLIPLSMVEAVVSERTGRRNSVASDISSTWGGAQLLAGPMLTVPYECTVTENDGRARQVIRRATFLPDGLSVQGSLNPEIRERNLFKVVVYAAQLTLTGRFSSPDLPSVARGPIRPLLSDASLNIGVADPRGVRRATLNWNGADRRLEPGITDQGLAVTGLHASVDVTDTSSGGGSFPFTISLQLNGSRDFRIVPAGNDTAVRLTSPWPHPGFIGTLPQTRAVENTGFSAAWDVSYFGRGFPRAWGDALVDREKMRNLASDSAFGVSLIQLVDIYQQADRAVKYAALFIVLTFMVFFLFEVVRARLLHPIQYLFVGFALCIFYLLLISLSEHMGFDAAYSAAAVGITLLISTYSTFVLEGLREGATVGSCVGLVYGFLYLLLRLEDYALLAGSVGLFSALTLVMLMTRRVNWYELKLGARG